MLSWSIINPNARALGNAMSAAAEVRHGPTVTVRHHCRARKMAPMAPSACVLGLLAVVCQPVWTAEWVEGRLFRTQFGLCDPTNASSLLLSNPEVRETIGQAQRRSGMLPLLKRLTDNGHTARLELSLFMRGLDGPGSSQDLPQWQRLLTDSADPQIGNMPKTPTIASMFKLHLRFTVSAGPTSVRYVARQYGLDHTWTESPQAGSGLSQWQAPGFVMLGLLGWSGMRLELELMQVATMAKEGGMGSSGAFNAGLMAGGSMLTGAGLSEADILALGTKLENSEFGGLTGGQELLSSLLGGSYLHLWLLGLTGRYDAFSIPLGGRPAVEALAAHALYLQAGKAFADGKPVVVRAASAVNTMWTDLLVDQDPKVEPVLARMKQLAGQFALAIKEQSVAPMVSHVNEFVALRIQMGQRWLQLLAEATVALNQLLAPDQLEVGALDKLSSDQRAGLADRLGSVGMARAGVGYALKVWVKDSPSYAEFGAVRTLWLQCDGQPEGLSKRDLYVSPEAQRLRAAAASDIAIMPLGAGGPGANMIVLTSNSGGRDYLEAFLAENGIGRLQEEEVLKIVSGSGLLQGWMPFTGAPTGWNATVQLSTPNGDSELVEEVRARLEGAKPKPPAQAWYDTSTGEIALELPQEH